MLRLALLATSTIVAQATCTASSTNICVTLDPFASETGYYNFKGYTGSSPEITAKIGDTVTFDQTDVSNWYHPLGFAYEPDGAHGSDWGGAELPEVEGAGELQYYIDGAVPTCADAGDTGLDCCACIGLARTSLCLPRCSRCSTPHRRDRAMPLTLCAARLLTGATARCL